MLTAHADDPAGPPPPPRFSITALEQQCQRCGRDVFTRMYSDEAARVADWLTGAWRRGGLGRLRNVLFICQLNGSWALLSVYSRVKPALVCHHAAAGAYELRGVYEERQQRASRMRRPHDKQRCSACRAGLH